MDALQPRRSRGRARRVTIIGPMEALVLPSLQTFEADLDWEEGRFCNQPLVVEVREAMVGVVDADAVAVVCKEFCNFDK